MALVSDSLGLLKMKSVFRGSLGKIVLSYIGSFDSLAYLWRESKVKSKHNPFGSYIVNKHTGR